jgi:hypothetical protein
MHAKDRVPHERRSGVERRQMNVAAYWRGALNPRRRFGRRATDRAYPIVDWHSPRVLALVKLILTSIGAAVLVACARMRLFRFLPGEALLYFVVGCYSALVVYELHLLENAPPLT